MPASPKPKQLDELYDLIQQIKTAMFTTRRADGRLVSRPMATQKRDPIADLWFVAHVSDEHDLVQGTAHRDGSLEMG